MFKLFLQNFICDQRDDLSSSAILDPDEGVALQTHIRMVELGQ